MYIDKKEILDVSDHNLLQIELRRPYNGRTKWKEEEKGREYYKKEEESLKMFAQEVEKEIKKRT